MTNHFVHGTRDPRPQRAPSAWATAALAVASWFVIAGLAGFLLLLGTS